MTNSTSTFVPPDFDHQSPLSWYQAAQQQPGFIHDAAQFNAIQLIETLWTELVEFKRKRSQFLGRSLRAPKVPKGLYFYGGVGRGKSFLMDVFFGCLPYKRKRRVHFHAFMAEVHERLKAHRSQANPLKAVAQDIAREIRVLCFDEFHVSDIADAMILGRLLEGLFAEGIVIMATSNYAPEELYPQGQNRSSFLPTIDLIKQKLIVSRVDGGEDYRLRTLKPANVFYIPLGEANEASLKTLFQEMNQGQSVQEDEITVLGRQLKTKGQTATSIWFDFETLCCGPRSQNDYLQLAQQFHIVFLSGIPKMNAQQTAPARRLTWLIDILYDYRVKFCATCAVPIQDIYTEGDFAEEFSRTASRLTEMNSESYWALPHLVLESGK